MGATRAANRISTDYSPSGIPFETGNCLLVEKAVKHVWLDHVEVAIIVHNSNQHGAPLLSFNAASFEL